jgi:hypothetical protein
MSDAHVVETNPTNVIAIKKAGTRDLLKLLLFIMNDLLLLRMYAVKKALLTYYAIA